MRAYDVGWAATNKLIRAGKSFSGRERNCAFLNTGGGRFADISAVSGLDFADDGRGLALTDWDHDGRIDLWVMNRDAPRVRFIRNELAGANHFVSLKLEGTKTNRDAIGARVEVHLAGGEHPPLVKSLYAGSGYLSQSSKWLHFGLGAEEKIESVEVRWPGGGKERFTGVSADAQFILREGDGAVMRWAPPGLVADLFSDEKPVVDDPPAATSAARVVFLSPTPIPAQLKYVNADGEEVKLAEVVGDSPMVLNLWATWCPNCRVEMEEWGKAAGVFESNRLRVLSLCVDEPSEDRSADLAAAKAAGAEVDYPFGIGLVTQALVEQLNILQRSFIGRQDDLPLPSSFLIDEQGRVAAVYKGAVTPEQLIIDQAVCGADSQEILEGAVPFQGNWKTPPKGLVPRAFAVKIAEAGMLEDARDYLHQLLPLYEGKEGAAGELAECERFLGAIAHDHEDYALAQKHYERSLELVPGQRLVHDELMRVFVEQDNIPKAAEQLEAILADHRDDFESLAQLGKFRAKLGEVDVAIALYRESLALQSHPETHSELAGLLRDRGRSAEAIEHYRAVLKARPEDPLAANNLAWVLATHPDEEHRDGAEAERLAAIACEVTGGKIPPLLGTLAAAHAESGDFEKAVSVGGQAVEAAREFKKEEMAARLAERLDLYRAGQAYRDPTLVPPGE